jgi:hypothetical protein
MNVMESEMERELDKYGEKTLTESAAIWVQEVTLVGIVLLITIFAATVTVESFERRVPSAQVPEAIQPERAGSLFNGGQEAN